MSSTLISLLVAAVSLGGHAGQPPRHADASGRVTRVVLTDSPYGPVLFSRHHALYVFTSDAGGEATCYDECAAAWPPLVAKGEVVAGRGVRQGLIGTTERSDGALQVTYRGKPLYGYVNDPRGKVYCHDVAEFGGTWYAVRKSGRPAP